MLQMNQRDESATPSAMWTPPQPAHESCALKVLRVFRISILSQTHQKIQHQLGRAELRGEISELHALCLRSIAAAAHGSQFSTDYLELAEAAAASPSDHDFIAETRREHARLVITIQPAIRARGDGAASLWRRLLRCFGAALPEAARARRRAEQRC